MAPRLKRCPSCQIHILEDATSCPFCSSEPRSARGRHVPSSRVPGKGVVAMTAGVVTLVAGIGCAYGCPDEQCGTGASGGSPSADAGADGSPIDDAGADH